MSYNSLFGLGSHAEDANLEGWWKLQETTGTSAADASSNARSGTITNMGANPTTAAGPNGWLASSFDLDGTDDYVSISSTALDAIETNGAFTIGSWCYPTSTAAQQALIGQWRISNNEQALLFLDTGGSGIGWAVGFRNNAGAGAGVYSFAGRDNSNISSNAWQQVVGTYSGSSLRILKNGVLQDSSSVTQAIKVASDPLTIGATPTGSTTRYLDGRLAGAFIFSRALSDAEAGETYAGPEPLNTVAPAAPTGTQTEGQTLTALTGTWDSQSNGTLTAGSYSYQWTRSNDGAGAGEADIGGATASTYTLVAGDVGKFIRCRVRAENDGGFDSAEDTPSAFTGSIASSGSTYTLTADAGSFALTGIDAGLFAGRKLTADLGTFALTGIDVDLTYSGAGGPTYTLTCDAGSFTLTGINAGLLASRRITADAGSFALTGIDAGLIANRLLGADAGAFALTGIDADLTYSGSAGPTYTLTCDAGSFALTGNDTGLLANRRIAADAGAFTLTGIDAAFVVNRLLTADAGAFVLTGIDANLTYSGATSSSASIYYYLMMGS